MKTTALTVQLPEDDAQFLKNYAKEHAVSLAELFARYAPVGGDIHGPHSIYFGLLAEHGFVGLGVYLMLLVACFLGASRLIRGAKRNRDPEIRAYADMFRFSLIGFLVSGTFLGRAYFDYFFTIVAGLVILERVARSRWAELPEEEDESEIEDEDLELPHPEVAY